MDMFDFSAVIEYAKAEPGHGLLQSVLLFMIWHQSKGLRKELMALRDTFEKKLAETRTALEDRFHKIEGRIVVLENKEK